MVGTGVMFAVPKDEEFLEWLGLELVLFLGSGDWALKLSCFKLDLTCPSLFIYVQISPEGEIRLSPGIRPL